MKLILSDEAEKKMNHYVQAVNTEIAGMGKVMRAGDDIIMTDVAIYHQEVTGGTANIDSVELAKFAAELYARGENPRDWSLWWHSHVDMGAFFSGIDTATIGRSTEYEYLISLVVNKKRERQARLDIYRPWRVTQTLDIQVGSHSSMIPAEIVEEVAQKLRIHSYQKSLALSSTDKKPAGFTNKGGEYVWDEGSGKAKKVADVPDHSFDAKGMPRSPEAQEQGYLQEVDDTREIIAEKEEELAELCHYGQAESSEARKLMDELSEWYNYYAGLTGSGYAEDIGRVSGIVQKKKTSKKLGKAIKRVVDEIKRQENVIKNKILAGSRDALTTEVDSLVNSYVRYSELTGRTWNSKLAQQIDAS
jgi:proteasome lid subunit RPN8/RPN11